MMITLRLGDGTPVLTGEEHDVWDATFTEDPRLRGVRWVEYPDRAERFRTWIPAKFA